MPPLGSDPGLLWGQQLGHGLEGVTVGFGLPGGCGDPAAGTMSSTLSPTDYDSLEIQQQYNDINNRWEVADEDWDNENSSARLFERSRIKALAGRRGCGDGQGCQGCGGWGDGSGAAVPGTAWG